MVSYRSNTLKRSFGSTIVVNLQHFLLILLFSVNNNQNNNAAPPATAEQQQGEESEDEEMPLVEEVRPISFNSYYYMNVLIDIIFSPKSK